MKLPTLWNALGIFQVVFVFFLSFALLFYNNNKDWKKYHFITVPLAATIFITACITLLWIGIYLVVQ